MQNIVGGALRYEERRLAGIVANHISRSAKLALNRLLEDAQGLHEITLLKRDPRDFSNHEIRREVRRGQQLPAFSANSARLHVHEKGRQSRAGARAPVGAKGQTGY